MKISDLMYILAEGMGKYGDVEVSIILESCVERATAKLHQGWHPLGGPDNGSDEKLFNILTIYPEVFPDDQKDDEWHTMAQAVADHRMGGMFGDGLEWDYALDGFAPDWGPGCMNHHELRQVCNGWGLLDEEEEDA